jgi:hypothetical protein
MENKFLFFLAISLVFLINVILVQKVDGQGEDKGSEMLKSLGYILGEKVMGGGLPFKGINGDPKKIEEKLAALGKGGGAPK